MSPERGAHPVPLTSPPGSPEQMQADDEDRPCLSADSGRDFRRPAEADARAEEADSETPAKQQKC